MSRIRELMRDKRVAAGVAVTAVLFSVYRIAGIGSRTESAPPPARAQEAAPAAPAPAVVPPTAGAPGEPAPPAPVGAPAATIPADVPWSWDRNPFLPKGARGTARGEGIDVPAGVPREAGWTSTDRGGDPDGDLRGTVVSGNSGVAIFGTRLVPRGDTVGSWTVERIEHSRVVLRRGAEVRVLDIFKAGAR